MSLLGAFSFYEGCRKYTSDKKRDINNLKQTCNFLTNIWKQDIKNNKFFKKMPEKFYFDEQTKDSPNIQYNYNGDNGHEIEVTQIFQLNLGKTNPLDFDKIMFFLDKKENNTYASLGNDSYYGTSIVNFIKNKNFKDIIKNVKINKNNQNEIKNYDKFYYLQSINPNHLIVSQKIGFTFFWEDNEYYLQILTHQFAKNYVIFPQGGTIWMNIGKGIKLYN
ncbi:hypothetical protein [Spiroplasma sp. ald]|uniref:hypothetical protein n=1 Tax=Spiroplasma sp. ald TaxID=2490849 RepID=UPI0037DD2329